MFKKFATSTLMLLVLNLTFYSAAANTETDAKTAEKVKAKVAKLAAGNDAKVKIRLKLKDGTKLKGYIGKINDSGFTLAGEKTGKDSEIQYLQVEQVEGNNSKIGKRILSFVIVIGGLALFSWGYGDG